MYVYKFNLPIHFGINTFRCTFYIYILINEIFSRNSIIYHKLTRTHKNRKYSIAVTSRYYTSLITLYYTCGMLMLLDLEM